MFIASVRQPIVVPKIFAYQSSPLPFTPRPTIVECLVSDLFFGNAVQNSPINAAGTNWSLSIVGPPLPTSNSVLAGTAYKYDSTHYVSKKSIGGTNPWTIAGIFAVGSGASSGNAIIGTCDGVGSGTHDRTIQYGNATNTANWTGYIFDGSAKLADGGLAVVNDRLDCVVATTDGATLWCYAGIYGAGFTGVTSGSIGVSNAGYNAYSTPTFCIGNPSNQPIASYVTSPLWLRLSGVGAFWTAAQATRFILNPWQVYAPFSRATTFFASSVAADTLMGMMVL